MAKNKRHWTAADLARSKPSRQPYKRVLIVKEGSKTEVNYFEAIRKEKKLSTAYIKVVPSELGTEPRQAVLGCQEIGLR